MARIGIINCSNMVQELDCAAVVCLGDLRKKRGLFASYQGEEIVLVGMLSCAGCPTSAGAEKILRKVRAIAEFRIDALHFSYCMTVVCPFLSKYVEVIQRNFPDIELVMGTHTPHDAGKFKESVKTCLLAERKNANDIITGKV